MYGLYKIIECPECHKEYGVVLYFSISDDIRDMRVIDLLCSFCKRQFKLKYKKNEYCAVKRTVNNL